MNNKSADTLESPAAETDPDVPELGDSDEQRDDDSAADTTFPRRLSISVDIRSFAIAAVITALVGTVTTLAWLYIGGQHKLHAQARESDNYVRAEHVALDYAANAAGMNYQDLSAWKVKLVAGTSPELKDKLGKAATSMEQILVPLQWVSTAEPLAAKVRSAAGGIFVVDSFVSVQTKTVQAPDAMQSTATYSLTIDSNKDWQITDVGGVGAVMGQK
jgi:Mce-associated membrane protein